MSSPDLTRNTMVQLIMKLSCPTRRYMLAPPCGHFDNKAIKVFVLKISLAGQLGLFNLWIQLFNTNEKFMNEIVNLYL